MLSSNNNENLGNEDKEESLQMNILPSEFYGGNNPVVTFKKVEKQLGETESNSSLSSADKKIFDKQTAVGGDSRIHPANLLAQKKFLVFGSFGIFILTVGVFGAYYIYSQKSPTNVVVQNTTSTQSVESTSTLVVDISNPPTSTFSTTTSAVVETQLRFPTILFPKALDSDKDGLTDNEEDFFTTDPGVADTDGDSFDDGREIFYLYNPAGREPMRLVDSGSVEQFTNDYYGYTMYYPKSWKLASVDKNSQDVLISTVTGDFVEVRAFEKIPNENFETWFSRVAIGEKIQDLKDFVSYFNEKGLQRKDGLVYYFVTQDRILVILYHPSEETSTIRFPVVPNLVARSLKFVPPEGSIYLNLNQPAVPSSSAGRNLNTTSSYK
jgi:hypothetical protein